jgi:hypothetical protein
MPYLALTWLCFDTEFEFKCGKTLSSLLMTNIQR